MIVSIVYLTTLVVSSILGSAALYLPKFLAPLGLSGLIGILCSAFGTICVGILGCKLFQIPVYRSGFDQHSLHANSSENQIHNYVYDALCKVWPAYAARAQIYVCLLYWLMSCVANAVFVIYMFKHLGIHRDSIILYYFFTFMVVALLNCVPLHSSYLFDLGLSVLKSLILFCIPLYALYYGSVDTSVYSISDISFYSVGISISHTIWAYFGIETAFLMTGFSNAVLYSSVMSSIAVCSLVYLLSTFAVQVCLSHSVYDTAMPYLGLASISLSNAYAAYLPDVTSYSIAFILFASLYAWTMINGQIAYKAAQQGILPSSFTKQFNLCNLQSNQGGPCIALLVSSLLPMLAILFAQYFVGRTPDQLITVLELVLSYCVLLLIVTFHCMLLFSYCILQTSKSTTDFFVLFVVSLYTSVALFSLDYSLYSLGMCVVAVLLVELLYCCSQKKII